MPLRCPPEEGRLEEVSTCALRTCEPLACTAGYLRSLVIRRLASDRKYLAHFYMPAWQLWARHNGRRQGSIVVADDIGMHIYEITRMDLI